MISISRCCQILLAFLLISCRYLLAPVRPEKKPVGSVWAGKKLVGYSWAGKNLLGPVGPGKNLLSRVGWEIIFVGSSWTREKLVGSGWAGKKLPVALSDSKLWCKPLFVLVDKPMI